MVKFKSSLIIIIILLLPTSTGEVEIRANGILNLVFVDPGDVVKSNLVLVDAGDVVTFSATGLVNATSVLWDFGRDIGGA